VASTSLIVPPAAKSPPARVRRLLCAIDFSNASQAAVAAAVGMARACGAEVTILFVLPYGRHAEPGAGGAVPPDGVRSAVAEDLETLLGPARAAGIVVRVCLKAGNPAREVLEEIRRTAPDVVVMGTHARSHLSRRALGSVSDEILRESPRPVLTIACGSDDADLPASPGGVLCAVDLDDSAVTAIEWASTLARARAVPLTILHVAAGPRGSVEDARRRLRLLAARGGLAEGAAEELVVHGERSRQALRQAAALGAGLLVVALRRGEDIPRIDAATNRLIRGAPCAVLASPVGRS
jgi:nucleotide-binding universal stress UspA family protein